MSIDFSKKLAIEHSKKNTVQIAKFINQDRKKFDTLMKIFFHIRNSDLSRRASRVMRGDDLIPFINIKN